MHTDAIIYCRISQDRTGEAAGVARQQDDCQRLAKQRGWAVAREVVENDISAAGKRARPGFESLLADLASGAARVVIAWSLDRLTRNRRDTVRLIETCQQAGATIALVRGSDLDLGSPAGRLTADLLAAVARSEIEVKADRQARAALQAAEQGRWSGGRRAFGYDADGVTVREPEAQAVRDGFRMLLDGVSLRRIAVEWNGRGFTTPQGTRTGDEAPWTGAVVSRCLRKPRYAGLRAHKGEIMGEAVWTPLVDADTWHTAQAMMRDPSRKPVRGDQRLLTGVALCGTCGHTVFAGGGATGRGVYRCARPGPKTGDHHVNRRREPIDELIEAVIVARLSLPDAAVFGREAKTDTGALVREADSIRQRLDGLAEAYADGALTIGQLRKGTDRLRASLAEVEERLASSDTGSAVLRSVVSAADVAEAWAALTVEARRQIIDRLVTVRIFPPGRGVRGLDPETVKIEWRA